MPHADDRNVIVVEDVLVVRRSKFGWFCEIERLPVFLGAAQIVPGFSMPFEGTRGPVQIVAGAVADVKIPRSARAGR